MQNGYLSYHVMEKLYKSTNDQSYNMVRFVVSIPQTMFFDKYLLEIVAIMLFLLVYWCICKCRHQFAVVHSRVIAAQPCSAAVQESSTREPAVLVTGTRHSLRIHAAERENRGRMQVPVPEINHGAASVLALC
jgi:hypothetical protein